MPYRFPTNFRLSRPGFTHEKSIVINEILDSGAAWEKTQSFHWVEGWLLSHAGIHQNFLHPFKGFDLDDLRRLEKESLEQCAAGIVNPLFGCGLSRGGRYRVGGITWQDFDIDFFPMEEVNQIVGHTPHPEVQVKYILDEDDIVCSWDEYLSIDEKESVKSLNLALDTHRRHYAILENGVVQVVENTFATQQDFSQ